MRIQLLFYFAILSIGVAFLDLSPAWAGDPRDDAGLETGQPYEKARRSLIKLGFKSGPTNLKLINPVFDKKFPEVVCGRPKNNPDGGELCVAYFENKAGDFINLELKRTATGSFVLDEL